MDAQEIEQMIMAGIPGARVTVTDTRGDGQHYSAIVECAQFAGLNRIQQHQMVYKALGNRVGNELHALQLVTRSA
jgi:acid stress-induced BolA-like protein IbaG/YrbA